jgi:uncharacterized membrane protein
MTTTEYSVEVGAPPSVVWEVASDPRNLPLWDRHILAADVPQERIGPGSRYQVRLGFVGVQGEVTATVIDWEPPSRSVIRLRGVLDATVTTSIATLPHDHSLLRHEIAFAFRGGALGRVAAIGLNAIGGAEFALRRGTLAQKREIERRVAG